jgi:hypothetical protein
MAGIYGMCAGSTSVTCHPFPPETDYLFAMARNVEWVRIRHLRDNDDESDDDDYLRLTPAERVGLVWPITVNCWSVMTAARGEHFDAESPFQRDHLSVQRRER